MNGVALIRPLSGDAFEAPYRLWRNHPRPGFDFPDIAPMLSDSTLAARLFDALVQEVPPQTETLVGIDMGGVGLAGALAARGGLGLVDVRKIGSIRADVIRTVMANYELGDGIAISKESRLAGRRVVVLDDCLISGATALAVVALLRRLGAACDTVLFVFEIASAGGRERLEGDGVAVKTLATLPASATV